jgi:hypothetical protein
LYFPTIVVHAIFFSFFSLSSHFRPSAGAGSSSGSPKRSFLAPQASFSRFEDKKKRQTLDKNLKQIFQGRSFGGTSKDSPEKGQRFKSSSFAAADKKVRPDYPPEVKQVSQVWKSHKTFFFSLRLYNLTK